MNAYLVKNVFNYFMNDKSSGSYQKQIASGDAPFTIMIAGQPFHHVRRHMPHFNVARNRPTGYHLFFYFRRQGFESLQMTRMGQSAGSFLAQFVVMPIILLLLHGAIVSVATVMGGCGAWASF